MNGEHRNIIIDGKSLTLEEVIAVARYDAKVEITEEATKRLVVTSEELKSFVKETLEWLEKRAKVAVDESENELLLKQKMMYGTTTGFGDLKTKIIKDEATARELQTNIVLSHASGVGPCFDRKTTRAIMLLRANTLASGYCGVSLEVVQQLVNMLNHDLYPRIPEQGSVGASGDLAPLAHLALGLIGRAPIVWGEGASEVTFDSLTHLRATHPELTDVNPNLELSYKEGLALVNGITVMTGAGVLAYVDAMNLMEWADTLGAVTLECIKGSSRAFDEIVFTVYHHKGAKTSARRVREMIDQSGLINRSTDVHDAYSVRCIPQVHGAVRDALDYVKTTLEDQINSVDDDPIMFSKEEIDRLPPIDSIQPPKDSAGRDTIGADWKDRKHYEQGNFHGEPIAFAMDHLAIVTAELGNISERRIQMLLDAHHNRGLPACLIKNPDGVNSGYMIAQYVAAALVSENKGLCHPASVDSIPTSANTEDHVSMGTIAARKARRVIENVRNILAIELLCSTEALSYRLGDQEVSKSETVIIKVECGRRTRRLYDRVRKGTNPIELLQGSDVILHELIDRSRNEFLARPALEFVGE
jgi:histidine ammonia-lyase